MWGSIYLNKGELNISSNSVFSYNTATWGGVIHQIDGRLTIDKSTFSNNEASAGGCINVSKGEVIVTNSTMRENSNTWGGGLYQSGGSVTLIDTKITGNAADKKSGSALVASKGAALTIKNSVSNKVKVFDTALTLYLDEIESFLN